MAMEAGKSKTNRADVSVQVPKPADRCRTRKSQCPSLKAIRQGNSPLLRKGSAFFSIQNINWLDEVHLHDREQSALLSLPL